MKMAVMLRSLCWAVEMHVRQKNAKATVNVIRMGPIRKLCIGVCIVLDEKTGDGRPLTS